MANNSTTADPRPAKPTKDFPLFPHRGSGQWAKKIKGRTHYFGSWRLDPTGVEAIVSYTRELPYLLRGETPPSIDISQGCTIGQLCNEFMDSKQAAMEDGDLSPRTLADYHQTAKLLVNHFTKDRHVADLRPTDFRDFRSVLAQKLNTNSLKSVINKLRMVFNYGHEAKLYSEAIDFGGEFKRPSAKAQRRARNERGPKLFHREEILRMLETPNLALRGMIYLGINCGFGNSDVATLPLAAVDLERGWINYPRPKTEIKRRVPLWPETIVALKESLTYRPQPVHRRDAGLFFLTTHGLPWVRVRPRKNQNGEDEAGTPLDSVSMEFGKLLKALGIKADPTAAKKNKKPMILPLHSKGLNFYTLRHCFETIAGESKDQVAVDAIMGHVDPSMAANYRQALSDERLLAVANTVHAWMFPTEDQIEQTHQGIN